MNQVKGFGLNLLLISVVFLFSGCGQDIEQVAIPSSTPLPAPSVSATATHTPEPTRTKWIPRTSTPTITLTLNPEQAAEKTSWASHNKTHEHWLNVGVPATLEAMAVECKEGFGLEQPIEVTYRNLNEDWAIFTCSPLPEDRSQKWTPGVVDFGERYTQFHRKDLSQTWVVKHGDYEGMFYDRPDALVNVERWTQDGLYVYFYPSKYPAPSGFSTGDYYYRLFSRVLFRLELGTGEVETILPFEKTARFYAISPDDQYLIYSNYNQPEIVHLLNLLTMEEELIQLDEGLAVSGRFAWSPDSARVIFGGGFPKESDDWQDDVLTTSVYLLTIKDLHLKTIINRDPRLVIPSTWYACDNQTWIDSNRICVFFARGYGKGLDGDFVLGLKSGSIVPYVTSTP